MVKKFNVGRILIPFLFLLVIFLAFYMSFAKKVAAPVNQGLEQKKIQINNKVITVEVAKTNSEVEQGLSGRTSLGENSGMYFELGGKRQVTFWMKEMKFKIDIIWIDGKKIVGIEKNVALPLGDRIPTLNSPVPVTNVLEVNGGFSDKNNIQIGANLKFI